MTVGALLLATVCPFRRRLVVVIVVITLHHFVATALCLSLDQLFVGCVAAIADIVERITDRSADGRVMSSAVADGRHLSLELIQGGHVFGGDQMRQCVADMGLPCVQCLQNSAINIKHKTQKIKNLLQLSGNGWARVSGLSAGGVHPMWAHVKVVNVCLKRRQAIRPVREAVVVNAVAKRAASVGLRECAHILADTLVTARVCPVPLRRRPHAITARIANWFAGLVSRAPDYPLQQIQSQNMAFYKGNNDLLGDETDIAILVSKLQGMNLLADLLVPYTDYNHVDFGIQKHNNLYLNSYAFDFRSTDGLVKILPDIYRDTPQLIKSRGFKYQKYKVTTDDGYNLVNPYWRGKTKPLLLWHQLAFSSDIWLFSSPGYLSPNGVYSEQNGTLVNNCGNSLTSNIAFTLSSCGYDVWLGNTRGNRYSNTHQNPTWDKLWNYTFTETASIAYIGHSMGTTSMLTLLSLIPDFERHIRPIILLAPIAYLSNTGSIVRLLTPLITILARLVAPLGLPETLMRYIGQYLCTQPVIGSVCAAIVYEFVGYDSYADDPDLMPTLVGKALDNVSTKIYLQYGQFIVDGRFHEFDYGPEDNIGHYGQPMAPDYPVDKIRSKNMAFYVGNADLLGDKTDVQKLVSRLRVKLLEDLLVPYADWNHIDFAVNKHTNRYLNGRVVGVLDY
ncbi:unnamed protein product, partial [Medioppia subpectinata]